VRNAGSFRDAIERFTNFAQEHITSKNLEFAFVTLDSWDLRVQLPREARDKAVVLPPYLQHSRTFDLRTEYQRWQAHHPLSTTCLSTCKHLHQRRPAGLWKRPLPLHAFSED
jgi:hypothetical protein